MPEYRKTHSIERPPRLLMMIVVVVEVEVTVGVGNVSVALATLQNCCGDHE